MVLFLAIEQQLDCISECGRILGKISFDGYKNEYAFFPDNDSVVLSDVEELKIIERLTGLAAGKYEIPMQDDD